MLTTANLNHNIANIEDKCIELITQINQHLSTSVNGITVTNPLKKNHICTEDKSQQSMDLKKPLKSAKPTRRARKSTTKFALLSCHEKVINLSNNSNILKNFKGIVSPVHITKDRCNQLTRINQFLTGDENSEAVIVTSHARETKRKLDIQRLNHVNITPKLTVQTAFRLSLRDRNQHAKSNAATFECLHCYAETIQEKEVRRHQDSDGIDFEEETSNVSSKTSTNSTKTETTPTDQKTSDEITDRMPTEMEDVPFNRDKETLNVSSEKPAACFVDVHKELDQCELKRTVSSLELGMSKTNEPRSEVKKLTERSLSPHDLRFYLFGGSNNQKSVEVRSTTVAPEEIGVELAEVEYPSLILRSRCEIATDVCLGGGDLENFTVKTTTPLFRSDSQNVAKLADTIEEAETQKLHDAESRLSATDERVADDEHGPRENDWNDDRIQETTDMRTSSTNDEYCAQKLDELRPSSIPSSFEFTISKRSAIRDNTFHIFDSTTEELNATSSKRFEIAHLLKERMTSNPRENPPRMYHFTPSLKEKQIETRKIQNADRAVIRFHGSEEISKISPRISKLTKEKPTLCMDTASRCMPPGNSKLRMDEDAKHVKLLLGIINDCYAKTNARLGEVPCTDKPLNIGSKTAPSALKCSSSTTDDSISDELSDGKYKSTSSSSSCLLNSLTSTWRTVSSGEMCSGYLSPGQIAIPCREWNHSCNSSYSTSVGVNYVVGLYDIGRRNVLCWSSPSPHPLKFK